MTLLTSGTVPDPDPGGNSSTRSRQSSYNGFDFIRRALTGQIKTGVMVVGYHKVPLTPIYRQVIYQPGVGFYGTIRIYFFVLTAHKYPKQQ